MFEIRFSEDGRRHLKGLSARDRRIVIEAIEQQLCHQPTGKTRNKKQLRANPIASWELRVERFRVLYNLVEDTATVLVVAIAMKEGSRLLVEGQEFKL